jgi:SAM-dependent methyltransferase
MDQHEADLVLMAAQSLHDPVDAVAREAEHGVHTPVDQPFHQQIGRDLLHERLLSRRGRRPSSLADALSGAWVVPLPASRWCWAGSARSTCTTPRAPRGSPGRRHSHLSGVGLDLPALGPVFGEQVAAAGLSERLRFVAGDFLVEELPDAEVLVFGHVLHDWGLDTKRLLVQKAYRALPPDGAIICYDAVIDDDRRHNAFGLLMSLNMLIELADGFDYTGADCQQWLQAAGFRRTYVEHLAGPESMVVGIK